MKLDVNFKKEIEPLINSSEALANWFEKNQEMMAYFEMTHPGAYILKIQMQIMMLKFLEEWQMVV